MASAGNSERGRRQDDPGQGGGVGRGKAAEKEEPPGSGKSAPPLVANPEVEVVANDDFATTESHDDFEAETEVVDALKGWRIEQNSNGRYRYRWSLKNADGSPQTYITSTGRVGYRRGSKYLTDNQALGALKKNGKKRKK